MARCYIGATAAIPLSLLTPTQKKDIEKFLTHDDTNFITGDTKEVLGYWEDDHYIYVPRTYGITLCNQLHISTELSLEAPDLMITSKSKVRPRQYQIPTIDDMVDHFKEGSLDLALKAATGMGKTVMSIITAIKLGYKTLIITDQDNLHEQWKDDNLLNPKMFDINPALVGEYKANKKDYKNKDFVLATAQTLTRTELPEDFYDGFGLVIFDEAHTTASANTYIQILEEANIYYRLTVTATPRKGDCYADLVKAHVGDIQLSLTKKHASNSVRIIENDTIYSDYANRTKSKHRLLAEITNDTARNMKIVEAVSQMYDDGRFILVLSDRIEHLFILKSMLKLNGIDEDEIGIACGDNITWRYEHDPLPSISEFKEAKDNQFSWVTLVPHRKKQKPSMMKQARENNSIVLATFSTFKKGVDVPRLDCGIDATPQAEAEQAHGRILRVHRGKMMPIWITIRDVHAFRCEQWLLGRVRDYITNSGELRLWELETGEITKLSTTYLKTVGENMTNLRKGHPTIIKNILGENVFVESRIAHKRSKLPKARRR